MHPIKTNRLIAYRGQPYDLAFFYWHFCSLKSVNIFIIKLRLFSGTVTLKSRHLPLATEYCQVKDAAIMNLCSELVWVAALLFPTFCF